MWGEGESAFIPHATKEAPEVNWLESVTTSQEELTGRMTLSTVIRIKSVAINALKLTLYNDNKPYKM